MNNENIQKLLVSTMCSYLPNYVMCAPVPVGPPVTLCVVLCVVVYLLAFLVWYLQPDHEVRKYVRRFCKKLAEQPKYAARVGGGKWVSSARPHVFVGDRNLFTGEVFSRIEEPKFRRAVSDALHTLFREAGLTEPQSIIYKLKDVDVHPVVPEGTKRKDRRVISHRGAVIVSKCQLFTFHIVTSTGLTPIKLLADRRLLEMLLSTHVPNKDVIVTNIMLDQTLKATQTHDLPSDLSADARYGTKVMYHHMARIMLQADFRFGLTAA